MYQIFIVDDDLTVQRELKILLENHGYRATLAKNFTDIPEEIEEQRPDLVLLDISLPSEDGIMLCSKIRMLSDVPIIFVTSQNSSAAELECMLSGGDDFIEKPYRPAVLLAHISAVLRRSAKKENDNVLSFGALELDLVAGKLRYAQSTAELSKNELHILRFFFEHKGEIVSREALMNNLWDNESFVDDNTLSVNIKRIRSKLESVGVYDAIETKRGMGYIFKLKRNGADDEI